MFHRLVWAPLGVLCLSCVTGVDVGETGNPAPFASGLEPPTLVVGAAARTVVVHGTGFVPGSVATWNGAERSTEHVADTELRVTLEAADVAVPLAGRVAVSNPEPGGGVSGALALVVGVPAPRLDSLTPESAQAVPTSGLELRIFGDGFSDFGSGSVVVFAGAGVPTAVLSETELEASVPDHLLQRGQATEIFVLNPSPGGGASQPLAFTLLNPVPVLSSVSPDSVRLKSPAEVELLGSDFVQGSLVRLGDDEYVPVTLSPSRIVFRIPPEGPSRDGRLRVVSPVPGGGESNEIPLGIQELQPQIGRTFPMALEQGAGPQAIRVTGIDFAPDARVRLGASYRSASVLDSSTIEFEASAAADAALGSQELIVENARGGGESSPFELATVPAGRIAYGFRFGVLVTSRLNGADPTIFALETGVTWDMGVDWVESFPSGDRVLFTKTIGFFDDTPGLFVAEPNGNVTTITTEIVETPAISSDASWIYFTREGDLLRMHPDGTGTELVLAAEEGTLIGWPDISPDGDRVVFTRFNRPPPLRSELGILDLESMQVTSLGVGGELARWSPDGEWIAYRGAQSGSDKVRRIRPDGSDDEALSLGQPIREPGGLDWSPDGRYLAVMAYQIVDDHGTPGPGGAIRIVDTLTGGTYVVPPAVCDCVSGLYVAEWWISWFAAPSTP